MSYEYQPSLLSPIESLDDLINYMATWHDVGVFRTEDGTGVWMGKGSRLVHPIPSNKDELISIYRCFVGELRLIGENECS